jgi:excisionase family DNA binding protein
MSSPEKKVIPLRAAPDVMARLEKLEDSFLAGLQEIRAVKAELKQQAKKNPELENFLDAKEVAELFGENERWVYRQAKSKEIPSIKIGKYLKFSPAALQRWLEKKNSG